MPNIFVITPKTKVSYKKIRKLLVLENRENQKEIPISKVDSLFLFNENSINSSDIRTLLSKNIHIYEINSFGNIKNLFTPKKRGYKFAQNKAADILAYIVAKESLYLMSTIKKIDRLQGSIFNSNIRQMLDEFFLKTGFVSDKEILMVHRENILSLYSFLQMANYTDGNFIRRYESKDKTNVALNIISFLSYSIHN